MEYLNCPRESEIRILDAQDVGAATAPNPGSTITAAAVDFRATKPSILLGLATNVISVAEAVFNPRHAGHREFRRRSRISRSSPATNSAPRRSANSPNVMTEIVACIKSLSRRGLLSKQPRLPCIFSWPFRRAFEDGAVMYPSTSSEASADRGTKTPLRIGAQHPAECEEEPTLLE